MSKTDKDVPEWVSLKRAVEDGKYKMIHNCQRVYAIRTAPFVKNPPNLRTVFLAGEVKEMQEFEKAVVDIKNFSHFKKEVHPTVTKLKFDGVWGYDITPKTIEYTVYVFPDPKYIDHLLTCTPIEFYDFETGVDTRTGFIARCFPSFLNRKSGEYSQDRHHRCLKNRVKRSLVRDNLREMKDRYNYGSEIEDVDDNDTVAYYENDEKIWCC